LRPLRALPSNDHDKRPGISQPAGAGRVQRRGSARQGDRPGGAGDSAGRAAFSLLTREQRLKRLEAIARLLDVAFILPGTKLRYGIDGIIGLIPVVGDIIATALSLWLVREARALGAPWHITARMLGNVAFQGIVGTVPVAGDAIDVLFRANMRNARLLRNWLEKQPY
jgi:hypothetical protein